MALYGAALRLSDGSEILAMRYEGDGGFSTEVSGESFYQDAIKDVFRIAFVSSPDDKLAILAPEDDNEHDSNAVRVLVDMQVVGYLGLEDAKTYRKAMRRHWRDMGALLVTARVIGGRRGRLVGVVLDLDFPLPDAED